MSGSMTAIVALCLAACFAACMAILARRDRCGRGGSPARCPRCQTANPTRAVYCASCGQKLGS